MNRRVVDVFLQDRLVASYPIVIEDDRTNLSSDDFIDEMKRWMRERDSSVDVTLARFVVRQISE